MIGIHSKGIQKYVFKIIQIIRGGLYLLPHILQAIIVIKEEEIGHSDIQDSRST